MTEAIAAYGTLLKIGDGGGSESFTTIAEVINIDGPELMLVTADATNHSSSGATKEKIATLKELGEITLLLNLLIQNATQSYSAGLIKDWFNRTKRNFQLVFPDATTTTWQGPAYVTRFKTGAPSDGKLGAEVTLTPAGAWTLE